MKAIADNFTKYTPGNGILELRQEIVKKLREDNGVEYALNEVTTAVGAKQAIASAMMVLAGPGDEVLLPIPCWVSYTEMIRLAGATPVFVPVREDNYELDLDAIEKAITPRTKAIVICTPNNPTGAVYSEESLRKLAALAVEHDFFVVADEIYEKLVYDGAEHFSVASISQEVRDRTVTVNGFSKAYAITDFGALRGCDARVWSFFDKHAKGMDKYLPWIMNGEGEPMPLWVKPDSVVDVRNMQWAMRDHFEDTPFDMTKDVGAGPYKVPYRWRPMTFKVDDVEYTNERAIATQQTGFSFVAQLRDNVPDAMKGVLWFGVDDANTCVYVPIYCCVTKVPYCYAHGNGDMLTLSWDAAFWVHNYVANQAYNRYSQMIPDIRRVQNGLEDSIASAVKVVEAEVMTLPDVRQREELSNFSDFWANHSTKEFKKLGDYLLVKYIDGNIKRETEPGVFKRTPEGMCASPEYGGYSEDYYRAVAKDAGERLKVIDIKAGK